MQAEQTRTVAVTRTCDTQAGSRGCRLESRVLLLATYFAPFRKRHWLRPASTPLNKGITM